MRWIAGIVLVVAGLVCVASWLDVSFGIGNGQFTPTVWRHTADGWEKVSALSGQKVPASAATEVSDSHPHPLIVSLGVALLSLMALIAFSPSPGAPGQDKKSRLPKVDPILRQQELRTRAWFDEANLP